jgi:arylsulfatase A-like enzyme
MSQSRSHDGRYVRELRDELDSIAHRIPRRCNARGATCGLILLAAILDCSAPVPIDFVRLVDVWVSADPHQRQVAPQAKIGDETRIGFPILVGQEERLEISVPQNAELQGAIGVVNPSAGGEIELSISVCGSDREGKDLRIDLWQGHANGLRWSPIRVDFSRFAGETVGLCLFARGGANTGADVELWLANATLAARDVVHRPSTQPNLILITRQGRAGRPPDESEAATPNLDRLAGEGEYFRSVVANSSAAGPSLTSLLTGLHPREQPAIPGEEGTGVSGASRGELLPEVLSLSELFWSMGYGTAGFAGEAALSAEHGFAQGFDLYVDPAVGRPRAAFRAAAASSEQSIVEQALDWIANSKSAFFLFLHFGASEVSALDLDRDVAKLVSYLKEEHRYSETMIVVVSSPAESTSSSRVPERTPRLTDAELRQPVVVKYAREIPRRRRGRIYDHRVDFLDLRASIFREMGLSQKYIRKKASEDKAPPPGEYGLHSHRAYHFVEVSEESRPADSTLDQYIAVYFEDWKLVRDGRGNRWLVDLSSDPTDSETRALTKNAVLARLDSVLDGWSSSEVLSMPPAGVGNYSPELVEVLKTLE